MIASPPRVLEWRRATQLFEDVGAFAEAKLTITDAGAAEQVSGAMREVDPDAALYGVRTLDAIVLESVATERFAAALFAAFAFMALMLAFVGVYGVTDQAVSQRMHEFGVRIALGADGQRIRRLVIGRSLRLSAIGIVIGVAAAAALSKVLAGQLFGVSPLDPRAYTAVAALLALSGLAAGSVPARRATKTDPMTALRAVSAFSPLVYCARCGQTGSRTDADDSMGRSATHSPQGARDVGCGVLRSDAARQVAARCSQLATRDLRLATCDCYGSRIPLGASTTMHVVVPCA